MIGLRSWGFNMSRLNPYELRDLRMMPEEEGERLYRLMLHAGYEGRDHAIRDLWEGLDPDPQRHGWEPGGEYNMYAAYRRAYMIRYKAGL